MKMILIVGGGNMGLAIAKGIIKKGLYKKQNVIFIETKLERIKFLQKNKFFVFNNLGNTIKRYKNNLDLILIAVKPHDLENALLNTKELIPKKTVLVSILAGTSIKTISSLLNKNQPIARVMPNTPCQIGHGMSVIAFNKHVKEKQKEIVLKIFKSLGDVTELSENKLNLSGAINGSGPAYFCYLIECLITATKKLGISEKIAYKLVLQTGLGTMYLLSKTNLTPQDLRNTVTSKKGITEAAFKVFQKRKFHDIVYSAVKAAIKRSEELGKL